MSLLLLATTTNSTLSDAALAVGRRRIFIVYQIVTPGRVMGQGDTTITITISTISTSTISTRQLGIRTWRWEECVQTAPAEYCSSCATIALLAGSSEWKYAGH